MSLHNNDVLCQRKEPGPEKANESHGPTWPLKSKQSISCLLWKINSSNVNPKIINSLAMFGFDPETEDIFEYDRIYSSIGNLIKSYRREGRAAIFKENGARWEPLRDALTEAFHSRDLSSKHLRDLKVCSRFGETRRKKNSKDKHKIIYRCGNPACPTCGCYDRKRYAEERAKDLIDVLKSPGYRECIRKVGATPAVLHWMGSLPPIVIERIQAQIIPISSPPSGVHKKKPGNQWGCTDALMAAYLKKVSQALRKAADRFASELFLPRIPGITKKDRKSLKTLWQLIDVHWVSEGDPTDITPHVHAVSPGLMGSCREGKDGIGKGVFLVKGWPHLTRFELRKARSLWREIVLEELTNEGVYAPRGDEPNEFVVRFKPYKNPDKKKIKKLCCYVHRSHWNDVLNSLMAVVTPQTDKPSQPEAMVFRCHYDVPSAKHTMPDGKRIQLQWVKEVRLEGHQLSLLKMIVGAHPGVSRSQKYGGWRDKPTLASLGIVIRKPHKANPKDEEHEILKTQFRHFQKSVVRPRKQTRLSLRSEYRTQCPQTGVWSSWKELNPKKASFKAPWELLHKEGSLDEQSDPHPAFQRPQFVVGPNGLVPINDYKKTVAQ